jgi:hypothetical protein
VALKKLHIFLVENIPMVEEIATTFDIPILIVP